MRHAAEERHKAGMRRCGTVTRKGSNKLSTHPDEEGSSRRTGWIRRGERRPQYVGGSAPRKRKRTDRVALERVEFRGFHPVGQDPAVSLFQHRKAATGFFVFLVPVRAAVLRRSLAGRLGQRRRTKLRPDRTVDHRRRFPERKTEIGHAEQNDEDSPNHAPNLFRRSLFSNSFPDTGITRSALPPVSDHFTSPFMAAWKINSLSLPETILRKHARSPLASSRRPPSPSLPQPARSRCLRAIR